MNYLGEIVGGRTPKTNVPEYWDGKIPWLTPTDMKYISGKYANYGKRMISQAGLNSSSAKLMPKNSILYSSRAPIGYIAIAENEISTNQGFKSLVPVIHDIVNYIYYALIQRTKVIQSRASGTTFKEISGKEFGQTIIPLPPLNEQQRIVEKIETLLPKVQEYDHLEKQSNILESTIMCHLKKSLLQYAIQGKLVPQNPNDEPASVLLERIRAEKNQLIKEGKLKRDKNESYIYRGSDRVCETFSVN
ncbi:MAG: restriction endonuclease subunit S [Clostridium sp.]|nr:restriction endonuclease subunit S [Clostridium sp.]